MPLMIIGLIVVFGLVVTGYEFLNDPGAGGKGLGRLVLGLALTINFVLVFIIAPLELSYGIPSVYYLSPGQYEIKSYFVEDGLIYLILKEPYLAKSSDQENRYVFRKFNARLFDNDSMNTHPTRLTVAEVEGFIKFSLR